MGGGIAEGDRVFGPRNLFILSCVFSGLASSSGIEHFSVWRATSRTAGSNSFGCSLPNSWENGICTFRFGCRNEREVNTSELPCSAAKIKLAKSIIVESVLRSIGHLSAKLDEFGSVPSRKKLPFRGTDKNSMTVGQTAVNCCRCNSFGEFIYCRKHPLI